MTHTNLSQKPLTKPPVNLIHVLNTCHKPSHASSTLSNAQPGVSEHFGEGVGTCRIRGMHQMRSHATTPSPFGSRSHTQKRVPCSLGVGRASTAHPAHSGAPSRPTSATGRRAYTHASAHLAPHAGNAPAACGSTTPHPRTAHARTSAAGLRGATVSSPPTHSSHPTLTFAQEERAAWRTPAH